MSLGDQFPLVLAAAQTGADWGLASLYRDLQPRLLRYFQAHEPMAAEDLASEVWLGVAEGLRRFSGGEEQFRGWIFTIARRRLADLRRAPAQRRTLVLPSEDLLAYGAVGDVEQEAIATLSTDAVLARIAALPSEQSEVLLLRVVAELPVAEVAQILGKRPGAVRVLQHRALRRLAIQLSLQGVTE
jgi:RNA polymerase sigma-70 factor (ECF subfamily)